jgi:hypothetical protein
MRSGTALILVILLAMIVLAALAQFVLHVGG